MKFNPEDPRITAYLFDELEPEEKTEFELLLQESPELKQLVSQTRTTIDSLKADFANGEIDGQPLQLNAKQRETVEAEIAAGASNNPVSLADKQDETSLYKISRRSRWMPITAVCVAIAILIGSAWALMTPHSYMSRYLTLFEAKNIHPYSVREETTSEDSDLTSESSFRYEGNRTYDDNKNLISKSQIVVDNPISTPGESPVVNTTTEQRGSLQQQLRPGVQGQASAQQAVTTWQSDISQPSNSAPQSDEYKSLFIDGTSAATNIPALAGESSNALLGSSDSKTQGINSTRGLSNRANVGGRISGNKSFYENNSSGLDGAAYGVTDGDLDGLGYSQSSHTVTTAPISRSAAPSTQPVLDSAIKLESSKSGRSSKLSLDVEYLEGSDVIVVRGNQKDVDQVKELIVNLELAGLADREVGELKREIASGFVSSERLAKFRKKYDESPDHGAGPGWGGDKFEPIFENEFLRVGDSPLSTFSIDVDTASYSKVRMFLNDHNQLPRPDSVRIEELVNYFPYDYQGPTGDDPFAAHQEVVACPWNPAHRLVRIGIKGKEIDQEKRPSSNLVFLLDVSGSMDRPNKLPLLKRGMKMLADHLSENDRVAIVVYAGAAGMVLDSTTGDNKAEITNSLENLKAGGSTNGGEGIELAYQIALDHFIQGGTNRVILCTDGDFNVGTTGTDELVKTVQKHAKTGVFLSVLGFGMGNHNDSMLEQISNKGNGNYAFVDSDKEAHKVLVEQMSGTLVTIAKDVKIQIEFNPARVAAYRLIGYENRILAAQDFNDDKKDAGEIGAGHTVTALYELVPNGQKIETAPAVDELKYRTQVKLTEAAQSNELLTLKLRYKKPDEDKSKLLMFPLEDTVKSFNQADREFQFAASVASFGMLLRNSKYRGNATYGSVLEIATPAAKSDKSGYRREFLELVRKAANLAGEPLEAPLETSIENPSDIPSSGAEETDPSEIESGDSGPDN